MGWSALTIASLGRWASSTVLGYIEEALAEVLPDGVLSSGAAAAGATHVTDKLNDLERLLSKLAVHSPADKDLEVKPPPEGLAAPLPRQELQTRYVRLLGKFAGSLHACVSQTAEAPVELLRTRCGKTFGAEESPYKFLERQRAVSWTGPVCSRRFPLGVPKEDTPPSYRLFPTLSAGAGPERSGSATSAAPQPWRTAPCGV